MFRLLLFGLFISNIFADEEEAAACCTPCEKEPEPDQTGFAAWCFLLLMLAVAGWLVYVAFKEIRRYNKSKTPESKHDFGTFLGYRLDYVLSTRKEAQAVGLIIFVFVLILVGGILDILTTDHGLGASLWRAWGFVVDAAGHKDEESISSRVTALITTVGGMLFFAMLIGLISESIAARLETLKEGKAAVLESNHVLILGWSNKVTTVIKEIALAEDSEGGVCIVLMADQEKEYLEQEISKTNIDLKKSRVVCRKGSPIDSHDLNHVSAKMAKVIIIMSPDDDTPDQADSWSLCVMLSLKHLGYPNSTVVELCDIDNSTVVNALSKKKVEVVVAHDFLGRMIIKSSRQRGLALVLEAVLGFEGNEFYIKEWPDLYGKTFLDALFHFPDACPLGVMRNGNVILNPEDNFVFAPGDHLVVLAEDDSAYGFRDLKFEISEQLARARANARILDQLRNKPEHILIVGWRRDLGDVLLEMDRTMPVGSDITVLSMMDEKKREEKLAEKGMKTSQFKKCPVTHHYGNPISRRTFTPLNLNKFTSVFILPEEELEQDARTADGRTLTSLLLFRDIRITRRGGNSDDDDCVVLAEVLNPTSRGLIAAAGIKDFVMSNDVVSQALAMVAECPDINRVLKVLLSSSGEADLSLLPASDYVEIGSELSFYDIQFRLRVTGRGVLLGYHVLVKDEETDKFKQQLILNPDDKMKPRVWREEDKLVAIVAEKKSGVNPEPQPGSGIDSTQCTPRSGRNEYDENANLIMGINGPQSVLPTLPTSPLSPTSANSITATASADVSQSQPQLPEGVSSRVWGEPTGSYQREVVRYVRSDDGRFVRVSEGTVQSRVYM